MTHALPCLVCGRYPNRPVTADAIVVRAGRLLLIERSAPPFAGMLALPGGFVDQGETPAECAVRELAEEAGLAGTLDGLVGIYDAPDRDRDRHVITFAYAVNVPDGAEAQAGDDAANVHWLPIDDLPALAFDHQRIVADFAAGLRLVQLAS